MCVYTHYDEAMQVTWIILCHVCDVSVYIWNAD